MFLLEKKKSSLVNYYIYLFSVKYYVTVPKLQTTEERHK